MNDPTCPKCGDTINAATTTDLSDTTPHAGDVCICWACGHVMKFDGPIPLPRSLTPDEEREVLSSPEVMEALIKVALAKKMSLQ